MSHRKFERKLLLSAGIACVAAQLLVQHSLCTSHGGSQSAAELFRNDTGWVVLESGSILFTPQPCVGHGNF